MCELLVEREFVLIHGPIVPPEPVVGLSKNRGDSIVVKTTSFLQSILVLVVPVFLKKFNEYIILNAVALQVQYFEAEYNILTVLWLCSIVF